MSVSSEYAVWWERFLEENPSKLRVASSSIFSNDAIEEWFLIKYWRRIAIEEKVRSYSEFERLLLSVRNDLSRGVLHWNNSAKRIIANKKLSSAIPFVAPAAALSAFLKFTQNLPVSLKETTHSFNLFSRFAYKWVNSPERFINGAIVRRVLFRHNEAPLGIIIYSAEGKELGTIWGYYFHTKRGARVFLTNIQGIAYDYQGLNVPPKINYEEYKKLNAKLGENWRVFFTREIAHLAGRKNIPVIGFPPRKIAYDDNKAYKRRSRQYSQTYKKAGFVNQKDSIWVFSNNGSRTRKGLIK